MFDSSPIIVGLEIGTSKVCAVVGELTADASGLNIVGLSDFHFELHSTDPGAERFRDQKDYFEATRRASDNSGDSDGDHEQDDKARRCRSLGRRL